MSVAVMIVDDDPDIVDWVALQLSARGYTVLKAASGQACVENLRQGFRGVILMDIMMPGMSGWDTIRVIVAEQLLRENLICMLTALSEPGAAAEGLQPWVFDYLRKPFSAQDLCRLVENAASLLNA